MYHGRFNFFMYDSRGGSKACSWSTFTLGLLAPVKHIAYTPENVPMVLAVKLNAEVFNLIPTKDYLLGVSIGISLNTKELHLTSYKNKCRGFRVGFEVLKEEEKLKQRLVKKCPSYSNLLFTRCYRNMMPIV